MIADKFVIFAFKTEINEKSCKRISRSDTICNPL